MRLTEAEKANIHSALRPHTRPGIGRVEALGDLTAAVERILDARSADMEARIAREFYAIARPSLARDVPWEQASPLVTEHYEQRARALLDAAPAGGAEAVGGYDFAKVRREAHERYEQEFDASSEVPHD